MAASVVAAALLRRQLAHLGDGGLAILGEVGRARGEEHVRGSSTTMRPSAIFTLSLPASIRRLEALEQALELGQARVGLGLALGQVGEGGLHGVDVRRQSGPSRPGRRSCPRPGPP